MHKALARKIFLKEPKKARDIKPRAAMDSCKGWRETRYFLPAAGWME